MDYAQNNTFVNTTPEPEPSFIKSTYEPSNNVEIERPSYKPKYGFGTQKRYKDKFNDNPGPGTYHIPCSIVEVNDYTRRQGSFDDKYKKI